jgi:fatty acid desaturase
MSAAVPAGDLTWTQVYPRLSKLMRQRSAVNVLYILADYIPLLAILTGAGWSYFAWQAGELGTVAFSALSAVAVVAIGVLQHRLSGLGHEASHYAMFNNKLINDLVSDLLLMMPTLAITQQFRATHLDHHRYINDPLRDPDAVRLGNGQPGAFPKARGRFVLKYVVGTLWMPGLIRYILGQGFNAGPFAPKEQPLKNPYPLAVAVALLLAFWGVVLTVVIATGTFVPMLLYWFLPLVSTYPFLMQLREIAHHSNAPDSGDLTNSRIFLVHPLVRYSVFPYGQDYHLTHHLFGIMPHYRAKAAHDELMNYRPYREHAVICTGYFFRSRRHPGPTVLDVLAAPRRTENLPPLKIARAEQVEA